MIAKIKLEEFLSFFQRNPELSYFLISTILLAYRMFLLFECFSIIHYLILIFLFGQVILMIFMEKIKKVITKRFFCLHVISMLIHFLSIYLVPQKNFDFFLGIEASLVLHLNFERIDNKILRYIILSFIMFFFLKKHNIVQTEFFDIIYFIFVVFLFENFVKRKLFRNNIEKKPEVSEIRGMSTASSKKIGKENNFRRRTIKLNSRLHSIQNPFSNEQSIAINIMNIINMGILVIDSDFDIIYANNCLFEFFVTKRLEEIKQILFQTVENQDISKSDFDKIPDFTFRKIFKKAMRLLDSYDISKIEEISENNESKKNLSNESCSIKGRRNPNLSISQEDSDIQFRNWRKRRLTDNLSENLFRMKNKPPKPKTLLNYLNRLLNYCKDKGDISAENLKSSTTQKDIEKYSMYANFATPDNNETFVLINFIPLRKDKSANDIISSNHHEIMITIRKLSEIEVKYRTDNHSKNKILGSFCHELRTPINGLINMLDLMQSHMNDKHIFKENPDEVFDELLSSAVISSHLLINQIDDFIDYFAYSNEMLELDVGPFDIHAFFSEIWRVFSYVAMKKNLNLFIDIDNKISTVIYNDRKKLKQIIYNLLNNSIRYTESGFIKISAKLKKTNYIEITVFDTGMGIKALELDCLGRINKDVMDQSKATCGFGLFVSNILSHLIEKSSPNKNRKGLVVYSEYGKGTCFSFSFKWDLRFEKLDTTEHQRISCSSISMDKKEIKTVLSNFSSIETLDKKHILFPSKERFSDVDGRDMQRRPSENFKPIISNCSHEDIFSTRSFTTKQNLEKTTIKNKFKNASEYSIPGLGYACECPKVLIVDDVLFNVEVCRRLLLNNKVASESVYNGLEAVKKIEDFLKNSSERKFCDECKFYKLILMDVDMPIKNGIEATKEILNLMKDKGFSLDIVGLSAFHQEEIKNRGREAGMSEFILKPINSNKMKDLIVKYILN